jgi:HPt (histidine-containing phosphotransfer) domain-containing protein
MGTEPVTIDEGAFRALMELGGKEFVLQMMDAFLTYAPKVILEARLGLAEGNLEPVMRMGHSLHSSGRTMGVERIKELGARIEKDARENRMTDLASLVEEMDQAFTRVKACLEEKKAGL